ncbi:hypothetical protein FPV67DRAFT_1227748 [Lyophyllum atratum]|nr:hypothetical protein FPV67DRAFT_1227748 [Lyophyllum atratum]
MISQYRRELDELRANFTVTSVMQMALRIFAEQNPRQLGYPWECSKPIYFIDAMNIKTSLPMEFCHTRSDFEDLLKFMFRKRRGRRFVERGDYALTNGDAEALNDHNTWHALVKPGTTITMHVVLRLKTRDTDNDSRRCPTCTYFCTHASLNDEVICPSCGTFFRVQRGFVEEEIQGTPMLLPRMNRSTSSLSTTASKATVNDPDFECTDIRFFRRFLVRLEDLSLTDAWSYINTVKTYLPEKCDAFMDILKDFLGHKIDTLTTIEKVVLLFDGYPDVIRGFNLLFPVGYHSDNSTDRNDQPLVAVTAPFEPVADFVMDQYDRARSYLDKVAHRYLDDRDTYKKVLDLFGMYATERLDTAEAYDSSPHEWQGGRQRVKLLVRRRS